MTDINHNRSRPHSHRNILYAPKKIHRFEMFWGFWSMVSSTSMTDINLNKMRPHSHGNILYAPLEIHRFEMFWGYWSMVPSFLLCWDGRKPAIKKKAIIVHVLLQASILIPYEVVRSGANIFCTAACWDREWVPPTILQAVRSQRYLSLRWAASVKFCSASKS